MKIVYLDQNKWIDLARVAHGKSEQKELRDVLVFMRRARDLRLACFPLSLGNYFETYRRSDFGSRVRLAEFLWEASGGSTIAWGPKILRYEVGNALFARFPHRVRAAQLEQLDFLGQGMGHAQDEPILKFVVPQDIAGSLGVGATQAILEQVNEMFERGLLRRQSPLTGECPPQPKLGDVEAGFNANLRQVLEWLRGLTSEQLDLGLHLMAMTDTLPSLLRALNRHGISTEEFISLGERDIWRFIDDLPTQRVAMHLLSHWARNTELPANRSDLYDWMSLVPAVAYCDVVVTEKLFGDLLNRTGLQERAAVITDLRQLPVVLTALSR